MTTTLRHRPALKRLPLAQPRALRPDLARPARPTSWERNSDRRDRMHLALSELFTTREDLTGVSVVADVLTEDLLWSA